MENTNETKSEKLNLGPIVMVDPKTMKANPMNHIFNSVPYHEYLTLKEDIKNRGILVPLIIMNTGYILTGHNRLKIALEIGLEKIPVQYCNSELKPDDEKQFMIKDNLFRRQLTSDQKEKLIKELYG